LFEGKSRRGAVSTIGRPAWRAGHREPWNFGIGTVVLNQRGRIDEQVEVVSMIGDITRKGSEPHAHAHVVVGKPPRGGHLLAATVRPRSSSVRLEFSWNRTA
jgi:hypothetical protein